MAQKRITKPKSWEKEEKAAADAKAAEQDRTIVEDSDELLDEIDSLLEGQEVLASYRQRGGE